ncbi:MAG TPA: right-handed parallel beta-helix repeat-containing protein [Terracidiphilus sp.]|jgi:hypothetical protein
MNRFSTAPFQAGNGSGIAGRSIGKPAARFPGAIATDSDLAIAVNRQQTQLALGLDSSATSMTVADTSLTVAYSLLSIDAEIVKVTGPPSGNVVPISRGFDGTTPAVHLTNAVVSGFIDAYHHNTLVAEVEAIEQALGVNLSQVISSSPMVFSTQYDFPAQTPGGTLATGNQVITLTPVPKGVNGTDKNHLLWITGGTGTAEAVPITGGTAVSGAASGTVIVTCAFAHSGVWTIQSASHGIMEARIAHPSTEIHIPAGTYNMPATLTFDASKNLMLTGEGSAISGTGTFLNFGSVTGDAIQIFDPSGSISSQERKIIQHLNIQGPGTASGGQGIHIKNAVRVTLEDLAINSFALSGILTEASFEITVRNCSVSYCGEWGCQFNGASNMSRIEQSYFGNNSRSDGYGGISIVGNSATDRTVGVVLDGVDVEGQGDTPFTTVTTTYGLFAQNVAGLTLCNSYFEGNVGPDAVLYQAAVSSIVEYDNWVMSGQIIYGASCSNIISFGNVFYGTAASRLVQAPMSSIVMGPDTALNSSPEATRLLGMPGSTGAGSAALGANSPATVLTAPYTWLKTQAPDGTIVFLPCWK